MKDTLLKYADYETPKVGLSWIEKNYSQRIEMISKVLEAFKELEPVKVIKVDDNGQVVIAIEKNIAADIRGMLLLDVEEAVKKQIDKGIHLWCEPVGDKSKLRNLRGVVIKS